MQKKVIVLLADGFEEVEAVTPVDYLRRADISVTIAAISAEKTAVGARGIRITADTTIAELEKAGTFAGQFWDGVIIPGGIPGASNLAACKQAGSLCKEMANAGKLVAAICASPVVFLAPLGLLQGKKFTCYPGLEKQVHGAVWQEGKAVTDGSLITSRGPGTAVDFSLAVVEYLAGKDAATTLAKEALLGKD